MTFIKNFSQFVVATAAIAALTGCGGGGDSSAATPASPAPATAAPTTAPALVATPSQVGNNTQTTVPSGNYASAAPEKTAFDVLNSERLRCGFGQLRQVAALDRAAKAHATWVATNQQVSHNEDATKFPNGFTGSTPSDRVKFQGYAGQVVGEDIVQGYSLNTDSAAGQRGLRQLLNAPYHLHSLLSPFRDVGVGYSRRADLGFAAANADATYDALVLVPATVNAADQADVSADELMTYPCAGSSGIYGFFAGETPSPDPSRNFGTNPAGTPIYLRTRLSGAVPISIQSFVVTETATGAAVATWAPRIGGANEPLLPAGSAFVMLDKPLKQNAGYTVSFSATANSKTFSRTFSFTTTSSYLY